MARRMVAASAPDNSPSSRAVRRASSSSRGDCGESEFITSLLRFFSCSWDDSASGQFRGDGFESMMEQIADVADGKACARADFLVRQTRVKLQPNELATPIIER